MCSLCETYDFMATYVCKLNAYDIKELLQRSYVENILVHLFKIIRDFGMVS